jgi:hypothetical protein
MKQPPGTPRIPFADRAAFDVWYALRCHFPHNATIRRRKRAVRDRILQRLQQGGPRPRRSVDRVRNISPQEFKQRFLRPGIPVLIEGAARDWACSRRWTLDFLREYCGNEMVKITQRDGLTTAPRVGDKEYSHEMPFREYVDQMLEYGTHYLRFSSLLEAFPELTRDLDLDYLKQLRSARGAWVQAFIGAKGSRTPYHAAIASGIFINVVGVKRWELVPNYYNAVIDPCPRPSEVIHADLNAFEPDLERWPAYDCADRIEVIQEPGDVLFFPPWIWHYVENLEHTIGVRYGFATLRDALVASPAMTYVRIFAAKPSLIANALVTLTRRDLRNREDRLLAPALLDD